MERLLAIWIKDRQVKGDVTTQDIICHKAKRIYDDLKKNVPGSSSNQANEEEFKASRGWFFRFKKRCGIHSVTMHGEAGSADIKNILVKWKAVQEFTNAHYPDSAEANRINDLYSDTLVRYFRQMLEKREKQTTLDRFFMKPSAKKQKMDEDVQDSMQVTFEDVAVSFSQEEWEYLNEEQKELYREVMKENYQTLLSLGSPTFTPKIISLIKQEEEPYFRDEPESEERETGKSSCSDHQIQHKWKREKNQGEDPVEMEQIQTQSENVCENISQGTEKINTKNYKQESKKQRDPTEVSRDGVRKCERNDRVLRYIPEDQRHLAEGPFQIKNSDKIISKFYPGKRKGKPHKKELQLHKRDHRNVKPSTSAECNKSFTQLSTLKRHKMIHTGNKPYTCTECKKSFAQLSHLKNHKMIHTGNKPYTCTECNKSFTQHSHLKRHKMIHTGNKPYTCTECNKSFTQLSHLKRHNMIHTGNKPYTCTECNKSFARLSHLQTHKIIHTGNKPYTCTECNKSFARLSHLQTHKIIHTGNKPYTCTECNKSFAQLSYLKRHKMIHTGYKPYTCTECNKRFTRFSILKRHKMSHTGYKPYTCTECNRSFTQFSNLKFHKKIHTGDKPYTLG
uniref:Zinc finger protein 479-like n=1 Tax=Geotrypetes seraphini TaxID=260995 RepID=A0A6P8Q364_GEOSA|nr:zinc finger protein 479-like [Geotrypetes seraphini]